jgi:anthranilate phosphoribosyltransferase
VAKHGNRSATSSSGSADVLEALGARIDLDPEGVAACIEEAGFGFMFAPAHHQATRFVVPVRRELAVRTVFNLLGPLTNPAGASRQLIGVSDPAFLQVVAGALALLEVEHALVVCSEDGLDELSTSAATRVIEVAGGELRAFTLAPGDVGIALAPRDYEGGTPEQNAEVTRAILGGAAGTHTDLALINAGAAIYVGGAAASIAEGVERAHVALAEGDAARALERYVQASQKYAAAGTPS